MKNNLTKIAFAILALSLTFSCSSNEDNEPTNSCLNTRDHRYAVLPAANAPVLGGIFLDAAKGPPWMSDEVKAYARDNLFKPGNVTEFLPVPRDRSDIDSVKAYYPYSLGTLFVIADKIRTDISDFLMFCEKQVCKTKDGKPLNASNISENITMHASVHYGKAAHRDPIVANCTDPIFKNASGNGNCYYNAYNFYLAWDLKDNNDKYVKAGTYKANFKVYWQIKYIDATGNLNSKKLAQYEYTETFFLCPNSQ